MLKTLPIETCSKNPEIAKSIDPHKRHCRLRKVSTASYKNAGKNSPVDVDPRTDKLDPPLYLLHQRSRDHQAALPILDRDLPSSPQSR